MRRWSQEQNEYSRAVLDKLPSRGIIFSRLKELYTATSADYLNLQYRSGKLFALKFQPPKQQPFLISLESAEAPGSETVIVDPTIIDPSGGTSIDFYVVSLNGRLVAVSLSKAGHEEGDVHVYETKTGRELPDIIPRVNYPTGGGSVAWNEDSSGVYCTRYPRGGERPAEDLNFYQQVYFHRLGTRTEDDAYVIGEEFPRIAETRLSTTRDGK